MGFSETLDVRITDSSLRDGSHPKGHAFSEAEVASVALDEGADPHGHRAWSAPSTSSR